MTTQQRTGIDKEDGEEDKEFDRYLKVITRRRRRWPRNRKVVRRSAAGGGGLARATANRSDTHLTHSPAKPKSPHSMETFSSGEDFLYCILHNVW